MTLEVRAEIDDRDVQRLVNQLIARGKRLPTKKLAIIGVRSVLRNFRDQGRPKRWEPLATGGGGRGKRGRFKKKRRGRKGKILMDTGRLRQSVESDIRMKGNVKVYTDLFYGRFHQDGTKHIPARPFMLWQREDMDTIRDVLTEHLLGGR